MKISDIFSKLKEKDLPVAKIEEIVIANLVQGINDSEFDVIHNCFERNVPERASARYHPPLHCVPEHQWENSQNTSGLSSVFFCKESCRKHTQCTD